MSPASLANAIRVLHEEARHDPLLAETVRLLATETDDPEDPFAKPRAAALRAARAVNRRRQRQSLVSMTEGTVDTSGVIQLIASIRDRKGVDRRRRRGRLLSWKMGRRTLHPTWQFDTRRGITRPGLDRVLAALHEVAPDPQVAHALMSVPREDLDGKTLADLFSRGRIELLERLILAAGDQG
jgi:hypothetical protein